VTVIAPAALARAAGSAGGCWGGCPACCANAVVHSANIPAAHMLLEILAFMDPPLRIKTLRFNLGNPAALATGTGGCGIGCEGGGIGVGSGDGEGAGCGSGCGSGCGGLVGFGILTRYLLDEEPSQFAGASVHRAV
jgi:hypothetical protein